MKEVRLQTERERQLELQLIGIIQRLQCVTLQAMEKQKKLEEECRQATEKLKSDQSVMNEHCPKQIFQLTEQAEQELVGIKQLRQKEELVLSECQTACQIFLHREVLEHDIMKKLQEDAFVRIEMLNAESRLEVAKYRNVNKIQTISESIPDEAVRKASKRESKLHQELNLSDERKEKLKRNLNVSLEGMSTMRDEVRQSVARQKRFQSLRNYRKTKVEQVREVVYHGQQAIQNELASEGNEDKEFQQDLDMSSERIKKLKQEITQADKRQQWLNKLESTCTKGSSTYELFQQTSAERSLLKEQLQQLLQSEEELLCQLQQRYENRKLSKKKLEMTSECLNIIWEKINQESEQMDQTCLIFENEEILQKQLKETQLKSSRVQEETEPLLSKEKKMQQELQRMSEVENVFHVLIAQLKYSRSGQYDNFYLSNYSKYILPIYVRICVLYRLFNNISTMVI